ncbi:hypothetical protein V2J09_010880 [Rumex salicifolius]
MEADENRDGRENGVGDQMRKKRDGRENGVGDQKRDGRENGVGDQMRKKRDGRENSKSIKDRVRSISYPAVAAILEGGDSVPHDRDFERYHGGGGEQLGRSDVAIQDGYLRENGHNIEDNVLINIIEAV